LLLSLRTDISFLDTSASFDHWSEHHIPCGSLGLFSQAARFLCLPLVIIVFSYIRTPRRLPKILLAHYLGNELVVVIAMLFLILNIKHIYHKTDEIFCTSFLNWRDSEYAEVFELARLDTLIRL